MDVTLDYGIDGTEARLAMALSGAVGRAATARLRPEMSDAEWGALLDRMREEIRGSMIDGVVRIASAIWLVTARG